MANSYNISPDELKEFLDIPAAVSNNERLGRLRRLYGFHMSDIDRFIEEKRQ